MISNEEKRDIADELGAAMPRIIPAPASEGWGGE